MREVVLTLPDTATLADFIVNNAVHIAETNSKEKSLTAVLTDKEIVDACTKYQAELVKTLHVA